MWGIHPESLSQAFKRVCKAAGITGLTFHDLLRHEATSRLFEQGLNPMEVAAITGHKTLQMLKRYTHLRAEDLVKRLR
ncbi:tyrosine-type recombinase/integrase [Acidiferrobacter sp.]|uniref:tyrosine-type recombinase/integrase n=1 Tax=Acidiferrobacter sp. TaxID=1872107 RepID=UPI002630F7B7|nr:tyrosine-type recombinase/integrase [Acidiferrobacter sp.]